MALPHPGCLRECPQGAHQRLGQLPGLLLAGKDGSFAKLDIYHQGGQSLHCLLTEDGGCAGTVEQGSMGGWAPVVESAEGAQLRGVGGSHL